MVGTNHRDAANSLESPWYLTDLVADYMRRRFRAELSLKGDPIGILPHVDIPSAIVCEADRMITILAQARRNPVILKDFELNAEADRANCFLNGHLSRDAEIPIDILSPDYAQLNDPSILITDTGVIVAWYLPTAVSQYNQDRIWASMELMKTPLTRSISRRSNANWRTNPALFRSDFPYAGAVNMSPAWFQQGHNNVLEISALLKSGQNNAEGRRWLQSIFTVQVVLSAAMSIMHPQMYSIGRLALMRIWDSAPTDMREVLRLWPSVYSSLSLMVNRRSPFHLDRMGKPQWLDQLLSVGRYAGLRLVFPTIRLRLHYPPGSVVAFSGRLLVHGADSADGERGCIAWYMQERVHRAMNVDRCDYSRLYVR